MDVVCQFIRRCRVFKLVKIGLKNMAEFSIMEWLNEDCMRIIYEYLHNLYYWDIMKELRDLYTIRVYDDDISLRINNITDCHTTYKLRHGRLTISVFEIKTNQANQVFHIQNTKVWLYD